MKKRSNVNQVFLSVEKTVPSKEYFQQDFELLYVLDGMLTVYVEGQKSVLAAEDILIINANKKHRLESSDPALLYVQLRLSYQLISDIIESPDIIFWCDSTKGNDERYDQVRKVLKQLLTHYINSNGNTCNFGYVALCYQLMDLLTVHFLVKSEDKEYTASGERFEDRIRQINNYIQANYTSSISLKDLSERLYLSTGYLSRFFKKNYGMSFAEYLTKVRLFHAMDDLLYTDLPITRIAYDNGFANEAVFNKSFKAAYGKTPSSFRKESAKKQSSKPIPPYDQETQHRLMSLLSEDITLTGPALKSDHLDATISVQTVTDLNRIWGKMINIGSARDLLRSEIREHIILLKEAFGIESVRFWNLTSEAMLLNINDAQTSYNFSRLDDILDFLLETGVKPHIELGAKPQRIMGTVQNVILLTDEKPFNPDAHAWKSFMENLMHHLVRRYGRSETDTWRMELWWDERNPRDEWHMQKYICMFEDTWKIIKNYSPHLEFGGYGINLYYPEEEDFLKLWLRREIQPDFLSISLYAYIHGEEYQYRYSKRNSDADALVHKLDRIRNILKENHLPQTKLYITEWNLTVSDRNYINDTSFKSAYIVKNILDFYGKADLAGYFCGSDHLAEHYDTNQPLFGGNGILTKDGILKPAGFAFEFLQRLYPKFIAKGKNYLITTDGHESYGIICHNMRNLNYQYYFTNEDELDKENMWKYYEDQNPLHLSLSLTGLAPGTYRQKIYRINEKNGNAFHIWAGMDYSEQLDREDIKYFRKICEPQLSLKTIEVPAESVDLKISMEPNEILFLRLSKN